MADRRRPRSGAFTGYPFTGIDFLGYPFTGIGFGEDPGGPLALIYNGAPTDDTTYLRADKTYGSGPNGEPVEFAANVPPYVYVGGEKRFVNYAGMTRILKSLDAAASEWTKRGTATVSGDAGNQVLTVAGSGNDIFQIVGGFSNNVDVFPSICLVGGYPGVVSVRNPTSGAEGEWNVDLSLITGKERIDKNHISVTVIAAFVSNGSGSSGIYFRNSAGGVDLSFGYCGASLSEDGILHIIPTETTPVTVNSSTQTILVGDEDAKQPWTSALGTKFGLKELYGGVDTLPAVGAMKLVNYTPYDITTDDINLLEKEDHTGLHLVDKATSKFRMDDGTNTAYGPNVIVAGTVEPLTYFVWNETEMFIDQGGVRGPIVDFNGDFGALGDFLAGFVGDSYQTGRELSWTDDISELFNFVYDEITGEKVKDEITGRFMEEDL